MFCILYKNPTLQFIETQRGIKIKVKRKKRVKVKDQPFFSATPNKNLYTLGSTNTRLLITGTKGTKSKPASTVENYVDSP